MTGISKIQKSIIIGIMAVIMGFGMLFISPVQTAQAQSPGATERLDIKFRGYYGPGVNVITSITTIENITRAAADKFCQDFKNANRGVEQECKWNKTVIAKNGVVDTPFPSSGLVDPRTDTVIKWTASAPVDQTKLDNLITQIEDVQSLLDQRNEEKINSNPSNAGNSQITTGATVQVVGERLSVRATPSGALVGVVNPGNTARVIDGPQTSGGHTWWKLDYQIGADGWSAADWLKPVQASGPAKSDSSDPTARLDIKFRGYYGPGVDETTSITTILNVTRSAADQFCQDFKNANQGVEQECKWDRKVIATNGLVDTPFPSSGLIDPRTDTVIKWTASGSGASANSSQSQVPAPAPTCNSREGFSCLKPGSTRVPSSSWDGCPYEGNPSIRSAFTCDSYGTIQCNGSCQ